MEWLWLGKALGVALVVLVILLVSREVRKGS